MEKHKLSHIVFRPFQLILIITLVIIMSNPVLPTSLFSILRWQTTNFPKYARFSAKIVTSGFSYKTSTRQPSTFEPSTCQPSACQPSTCQPQSIFGTSSPVLVKEAEITEIAFNKNILFKNASCDLRVFIKRH